MLGLSLGSVASGESHTGKTAPLFTSNDIMDVTIRAPFTTIMRERSADKERPATLTFNDAEFGEVTVDVGIRARGRFRRQPTTCEWAPLRLNFKKSTVKKTVFSSSDKMKLVTQCEHKSRSYSQALLSEYVAYRILNQLTDASFRVRLMRVTYVDTDKKDRENTEFAFIMESKDQLAKRIGLDIYKAASAEDGYLDARHTNLTSLFQYLIGNTDFSVRRSAAGEPCCHNNMLFGSKEREIVPIPYDFDMSGIVEAPHGAPSPNFRLRSVRQRLYRGRCANNEHVAASIQAFIEKKEDIYNLVTSNEFYTSHTRRKTLSYLDGFYKTIENPDKVQSQIIEKCVGRAKSANRRES